MLTWISPHYIIYIVLEREVFAMKKCIYCESIVDDDAAVCDHCGASQFSYVCKNCGTDFEGNFCPKCGTRYNKKEKTCPKCGEKYFSNACPNCGYVSGSTTGSSDVKRINIGVYTEDRSISSKNWIVTLFLCFFLGIYGAHYFYAGRIGKGLLYLFTVGLFGIGWLVDMIKICCGNFTDSEGRKIRLN